MASSSFFVVANPIQLISMVLADWEIIPTARFTIAY